MKLEGELGARLFDRLGRSVRLTDVGKTFLPRARSVLRELEVAKGDVVERKDSISGLVTVGVIPTVAPYFLPSRLTSFSRKFPQALLSVMEEIIPSFWTVSVRPPLTSPPSRFPFVATNSKLSGCSLSASSPRFLKITNLPSVALSS
jgi:hypothetical protein